MMNMHGGNVYDKKIKYDFSVNINPLGAPQYLLEELRKSVDASYMYPQYDQLETRRAIAKLEGLKYENIYCTNGASEGLMAIVRAHMPKKALVIKPSFYGYYHALASIDCQVDEYCLKPEDGFCLTNAVLTVIDDELDMLILANPNNPTGKCIEDSLLKEILDKCQKTGTILLLDECFNRLSDKARSMDGYVNDYSCLYIVNAFTKLLALPGIRAGYVVSCEDNIAKLCKQLPEWNLSIPAGRLLTVGAKILEETGYLEESLEVIRREREYLYRELCKLMAKTRGLTTGDELCKPTISSDTNFIFFKGFEGIYTRLADRGILIRDCASFGDEFKGYLRLAVKDHESNEVFIETLYEVLGE